VWAASVATPVFRTIAGQPLAFCRVAPNKARLDRTQRARQVERAGSVAGTAERRTEIGTEEEMANEGSNAKHRVSLSGKKTTLLGLGARTSVELARYLVRRGADVTITDRKPAEALALEIGLLGDLPVRLVLGGHPEEVIVGADVVFVTPGAPRDLPVLVEARRRGVELSSEIELLFAECRSPIVGITGSSGKTTTTTLVGLILEADGRRVSIGGNIGVPLIDKLDEIGDDSWVVLELSSFQLEEMAASPHIAAVLNVTPNHLDRHKTIEAYTAAKANILRYQGPQDHAILGLDDPIASSLAPLSRGRVTCFSHERKVEAGAWLSGDAVVLRRATGDEEICRTGEIRLRGEHNVWNVLAASAISGAAGASAAAIRSVVTSFAGVEHRIEPVRTLDGVTYYNDSIATTPERTIAALRSFSEPTVLVVGGRSKHLPLDEMAALAARKCRAVVTFGEMSDEVREALASLPDTDVRDGGDLESAIKVARALARPGDVVLMSPAGTSFDAYRDFEARGARFKEIVQGLR